MDDKYILEGKNVIRADFMTWAKWFETADRNVAKTMVRDIRVSTVFLGLDHQFVDGPPMIFETLVFGGSLDQEMDRYSTWDDAEKGHDAMVERVKVEATL